MESLNDIECTGTKIEIVNELISNKDNVILEINLNRWLSRKSYDNLPLRRNLSEQAEERYYSFFNICKYRPNGTFKAISVTEGHRQDKTLYDGKT